jgi:predicted transcriptional regulator
MAISVRLDDDFVSEVQIHAQVSMRSVPKQIEHWARIGRILEDNPDLTYEFVRDSLLAKAEIEAGKGEKYVRRSQRPAN